MSVIKLAINTNAYKRMAFGTCLAECGGIQHLSDRNNDTGRDLLEP